MSIRTKILIGFLVLIVLSTVQGALFINTIAEGKQITARIFDQPLTASTQAQKAWDSFRDAQSLMKSRLELIEPYNRAESSSAFEALKDNYKQHLDAVRGATMSDAAVITLKEVEVSSSEWHQLALQMLAGNDLAVIPSDIRLNEIESEVRDGLAKLVQITLKDASDFKMTSEKHIDDQIQLGLFLMGGGIVIAIVVALFLSTKLSKPVSVMTDQMSELAKGNLDIEVTMTDRSDEFGGMAQAVNIFKSNALEVEQLRKDQAEQEEKAKIAKKEAMNALANEFEQSVRSGMSQFSSYVETLENTAIEMGELANATEEKVGSANSASSDASQSVRGVSDKAHELSVSIDEINSRMAQTTEIAGKAVEEASKSKNMVESLTASTGEIEIAARLIGEIADQTNMLALNATIEAARAGEAGKGFAVVAGEVKNLANQTAKATEQISKQVSAVQNASQLAVKSIVDIGGTVETINQIAEDTAQSVVTQDHATKDIAGMSRSAFDNTAITSDNINDVESNAKETANRAQSVKAAADDITRQLKEMENGVDAFLENIRTA